MIGIGIGVNRPAASAAPSVDSSIEYSPDPGFDTSGAWAVIRCAVAASALTATSNTAPSATGVSPVAFTTGTYAVTPTGNLTAGAVSSVVLGSSILAAIPINTTTNVVVTDVTLPNNFKINIGSGNLGTGLTSLTVRKIA